MPFRRDQPESNHNGGWIGFSPLDGHLYIAGEVRTFTNRTDELEPDAGPTIFRISSFSENARREIYVVDFDGDLFRISPINPTRNEADIYCNCTIDIFDLLSILSRWGPCDGCLEYFDGNHVIDVLDLLFFLSNWA